MVCVVNAERGKVDPKALNCGNQSHHHISQAEARIRITDGEVEWVKEPTSRGDKGIVLVLNQNFSIRGLSCKAGGILARALRRGEVWAQVMRSDEHKHIYRRPKIAAGGEPVGVQASRSVFIPATPYAKFEAGDEKRADT